MDQNLTLESVVAKLKRAEFSGTLAKTLVQKGQGEFALLLAMLEQDVTQHLQFADEPDAELVGHVPIEKFNFYPEIPLSTEQKHYTQQQAFADAIHREDVTTACLLGCMFPSPLSLHNDAKRVEDSVLANCDIYTQSRLQSKPSSEDTDSIEVDPKMLFDTIEAAKAFEAA
ncbi:MAG: VC2046/SO_2500 family protein [Aestuariibacter sp.]